jgi:hypothetical protein
MVCGTKVESVDPEDATLTAGLQDGDKLASACVPLAATQRSH